MPVKLIRCDVDIMKKITLTPGTHVLGRGALLEVFDKCISRKHVEVVVNKDSVVVKSLHHNPVFFSKRGCEKMEILTTNSTVILNNSDKIGFLLTTYWFEIIIVTNEEATIIPEQINNGQINEDQTFKETCNNIEEKALSNKDSINQELTMGSVPQLNTNTVQLNEEQDQEASNNVSLTKRRRGSSEDTLNFDNENNNCDFEHGKKIKLESPNSINERNPSATTVEIMSSTSVRERCYYGPRCYRRNPVHLVQYSHPKDSDWGTGEKGECPHGVRCTKNDVRHWDTHNHPPGTTRLTHMPVFQIIKNGRVICINPQFHIPDYNWSEESDGGCCNKYKSNP